MVSSANAALISALMASGFATAIIPTAAGASTAGVSTDASAGASAGSSSAPSSITSAPAAQSSGPCTKIVHYFPPYASMDDAGKCYFSSHTVTTTKSIDCGGCSRVAMIDPFGPGMECRGSTDVPGTVTVETAVCDGTAAPTGSASASSTFSTVSTRLGLFPGCPDCG